MNFTITLSVDAFLQQTLTAFKTLLTTALTKQDKIMALLSDIKAQNDALKAAIAAEDTLIDSAIVLINGFNAKLTDIQNQLNAAIANAADPALLNTLSADIAAEINDITAKTSALAAAIPQNTGAPAKAVGTATVPVGPLSPPPPAPPSA
jgi:hypothetical protein